MSTVSGLPCRQPVWDFPAAFNWLLASAAYRGSSQQTSASLEKFDLSLEMKSFSMTFDLT